MSWANRAIREMAKVNAILDQIPEAAAIYDANGRLSREDKGNGTATAYGYDAAGQLLSMVNRAPDGAVQSRFEYTYDVQGNRVSGRGHIAPRVLRKLYADELDRLDRRRIPADRAIPRLPRSRCVAPR